MENFSPMGLSHDNFSDRFSNTTTTSGPVPKYPGWIILPVFGLPGYKFYLLHITGFVVLSISIVSSAGVLLYLNYPFKRNFFTRSIGERLVVYLSICDVSFCSSHVLDHSYITATLNFPPDGACELFGFFLLEFMYAQSIIVSFTAINALVMVVIGKRMNLGRYDWRLNVVAFGVPAILGTLAVIFKLLGPSGAWCFLDFRNPTAPKIANVNSSLLLVAFTINIVGYVGVLAKMRSVEMKLKKGKEGSGKGSASTKYHSTARIMMLFVLVYITQYWALVVYGIWAMISMPPIIIIWCTVVFTNIGGLLNVIAYTIVRKRQAAAKVADGKSTAVTAAGTA